VSLAFGEAPWARVTPGPEWWPSHRAHSRNTAVKSKPPTLLAGCKKKMSDGTQFESVSFQQMTTKLARAFRAWAGLHEPAVNRNNADNPNGSKDWLFGQKNGWKTIQMVSN